MTTLDKLKIITLNICMIPWFYPFTIGNNTSRAHGICSKLKELDYDIICLQELFDEDIRSIFVTQLSNYHSVLDMRPQGMFKGVNSGLAIFSKYPLTDIKGYNFPYFRGVETFAQKGFQICKTKINGETINIINTHLQSDTYENNYFFNYFANTDLSIDEIKEEEIKILSQFTTTLSSEKIILCGDLNIDSQTRLYSSMLYLLVLGDGFNSFASSSDRSNKDGRIDYILANFSLSNKVISHFDLLTDHSGVASFG